MWGEEKDNGDPWITTAPPDPPVELLRRYQLKVNNPDAGGYGLQNISQNKPNDSTLGMDPFRQPQERYQNNTCKTCENM